MEKVVLLLSGGIDSSVAAAYLKSAGFDVLPLFINHHQGPLKPETEASKVIASELGLTPPFEVEIDLMKIKRQNKKWLEYGIGTPGRNMVFVSIAVVYAGVLGAENVALATVFGSTYPDTSFSFLESIQRIGQAVLDRNIRVFSPFKQEKWTHSEVVKQGVRLGVHLEKTWSCYLPNRNVQCGICFKCKDRKNRFEEASIEDRTKYDYTGVTEEQLKEALFFV